MKREITNSLKVAACLALGTGLLVGPSTPGRADRAGGRRIVGETRMVSGAPVSTWARVSPDGSVTEAGLTLPLAVVEAPPARIGPGPAGAVAVLAFPKRVRETTYFSHFEMHWNPHGHLPACCFGVPHFDFHFYGVPQAAVWNVGARDTAPPPADRLPTGYVYPGLDQCVPQMGVHAAPLGEVTPGHVMTADMVAGFYQGRMTFIEPMIARTFLLRKRGFTQPVPRPQALGRSTRYPTTLTVSYDTKARRYQFVWGHFQTWAK